MPSRQSRTGATPRIEPRIGSLDAPKAPRAAVAPADGLPHVRAESRPRPAQRIPAQPRQPSRHLQGPRRHGLLWLLLLVLLALLVVLAAQHRSWFAKLLPTPQLNHLLDQGDRALAAGHLQQARGFYVQAQTLSGENSRVVNGLQAVGQAELARARSALAAHRYVVAQESLQQAQSLLGGGVQLERVQRQLTQARARGSELSDLVTRAQQAYAADDYAHAAAFYRRVLALDAGNAVARHGLDQVGAALAAQARASLAAGQLTVAGTQIRALASLLPGQADLPQLSASLAEQQRAQASAAAATLAQADQLLAAGHITTPANDNALLLYRRVLAQDPGNAQAQAGLARVSTALMVQAHAQTDAGDWAAARVLLDEAAQLTPHAADLAAAKARLARAQQRASAPPVSAQQRAQAQMLAQRAAAAAAQGNYLTPPGDSAFDLYRRALALDGDDADARNGLRALPQQAAQAAQQALQAGQLDRAGNLLEAWAQLEPGAQGAAAMRQRLGMAWLQLADRDLARGNRDAARSALLRAQHWTPQDAQVQALAQGLGGG